MFQLLGHTKTREKTTHTHKKILLIENPKNGKLTNEGVKETNLNKAPVRKQFIQQGDEQ